MKMNDVTIFNILNVGREVKPARDFAIALYLTRENNYEQKLNDLNEIIPLDISKIKNYYDKLTAHAVALTNPSSIRSGKGLTGVFMLNTVFDKKELEMIEKDADTIIAVESFLRMKP